jgi:signal transduction histidine kinase
VLNPILRQKGIKSLLGVPLLIEGRILGVLHVGSLHPRQFTQQDVQLLQIVGDRAALAIDHARMFDAAQTARHDAAVAEAMVKARDEFLSIAAHELKTPLTSLRLAEQTLLRRINQGVTPDLDAMERSLSLVDRQVNRLTDLVTDLLETVRLQAGTLRLDRKPTDLVELVSAVTDQMQAQTSRHQLVFRAEEPVQAEVDPLRFEQVVLNLLDNAVKFSPEGGQIDIQLQQSSAAGIRLTVRDRGIGVPPEHRAHLFERYYQAHGNEHRSGMGLGLYITSEIVEKHGGHIKVECPHDGGTRFIVEMPDASQGTEEEDVA